jgi:metal-responsive CopG/Arc/MetJ family transcriptional regulator
MKTVQVVLDERTLRAADSAARKAKINRSEFVRRALRAYVALQRQALLEKQHRRAYERFPVAPGELDVWDQELGWPET